MRNIKKPAAAFAAGLLFASVAVAPFAATHASFAGAGAGAGAWGTGDARLAGSLHNHQTIGERQAGQQLLTASAAVLDLDLGVAEAEQGSLAPRNHLYTLEQFLFRGVVNWGGYKFTYYSQQVLPGGGLAIPGRHVNEAGYVSDADGYIVLAGSAPLGTVYETPFGYPGKIYDRGTSGNHLDVYIR